MTPTNYACQLSSQQTTHLSRNGKWVSGATIQGLKVQQHIPHLTLEHAIQIHTYVVDTLMRKGDHQVLVANQGNAHACTLLNDPNRCIQWAVDEYEALKQTHPEYDFKQALKVLSTWARNLPTTNI